MFLSESTLTLLPAAVQRLAPNARSANKAAPEISMERMDVAIVASARGHPASLRHRAELSLGVKFIDLRPLQYTRHSRRHSRITFHLVCRLEYQDGLRLRRRQRAQMA